MQQIPHVIVLYGNVSCKAGLLHAFGGVKFHYNDIIMYAMAFQITCVSII